MRLGTFDRTQAAVWVSERTDYPVNPRTLAYWEGRGLLRKQRPGERTPCAYHLPDLVRLRALVELRRDGAPLQRMRRALAAIRKLVPEIEQHPGNWRLAVTTSGDVVRIEDDRALLELTRLPGQLAIIDAGALVTDARRALAEHAAEAEGAA